MKLTGSYENSNQNPLDPNEDKKNESIDFLTPKTQVAAK